MEFGMKLMLYDISSNAPGTHFRGKLVSLRAQSHFTQSENPLLESHVRRIRLRYPMTVFR